MNTFSCPNCGAESPADAQFCARCGLQLGSTRVVAAPPAPRTDGRIVWLLGTIAAALLLLVAELLVVIVVLAPRAPQVAALPTAGATLTPGVSPTPSITPTPSATPDVTPTPGFIFGATLISDTLLSPVQGSLGSGSTDSASYQFSGGAYVIAARPPKYLVWSPLDGTYDDGAIEIDAQLDRGPIETAFGIIFRYQDDDNFYFYNITADGHYSLELHKGGKWTTLVDWTNAPEIRGAGQRNRLRLEFAGDRMRLYVNDTLLDEVSDDTFRKGKLALAVNTFDRGDVAVRFNNLLVQGPRE